MDTIKSRIILVLLVCVSQGVGATGASTASETSKEVEGKDGLRRDVAAVVGGNNEFGFELYRKLAGGGEEGKGKNLFFSPYSVSAALAMTWAGARGETAEQMRDVLNFSLEQEKLHPAFAKLVEQMNEGGGKGLYELSVANSLWGQEGYKFRDEFVGLLKESYGAGLEKVDFIGRTEEARKRINEWVEDRTKEKIKDLLKPGVLDTNTRLVLANAIYFKGEWLTQFEKRDTQDAPFFVEPEKKVTVPMMYVKKEFGYGEMDLGQVLEMPYKGEALSMVVILPGEGNLKRVEEQLTAENVGQWLEKTRKREVEVYVPRFKLTREFELAKILAAMGMPDAFTPEKADFSGMAESRELFISNVIHKAFVDVNEEGTEAAAATGVVVGITSVGPATPVFRADRPFVFLIRDKGSGSVLFMGRVVSPVSELP